MWDNLPNCPTCDCGTICQIVPHKQLQADQNRGISANLFMLQPDAESDGRPYLLRRSGQGVGVFAVIFYYQVASLVESAAVQLRKNLLRFVARRRRPICRRNTDLSQFLNG